MLLRSPTSKRTAAVSSSLSIGGLSRRQANAAVQTLIDHGLLSRERGGRRPRYRIVPGHEVPPVLSPDERDTYDVVVRKGKFSASGYRLIVAGMLAGG